MQDFIDRFRRLEERVRQLEIRPGAYIENVIVGGAFDTGTIVPPFFVPFGGSLLCVYGSTLSGDAQVEVRHNGDLVDIFLFAPGQDHIELDPTVDLDEGDEIQILITGVDLDTSGLSVGFVIGP